MALNEALLAIKSHPSKVISDAALSDPSIVNLAIGEASYGAPSSVRDAVAAMMAKSGAAGVSAGYNRYAHSRGSQRLRRAISERYRRLYDLKVDPERELL